MIQRLSVAAIVLACVAACGGGTLLTTDFSGENLRVTDAGLYWSTGAALRFLPHGSDTPTTLATLPGAIDDLTVGGDFIYVLHKQSPTTFAPDISKVPLGGGRPSFLVNKFGSGMIRIAGVIGERVYYSDSLELRVVGQTEPVVSEMLSDAVVVGDRILLMRVGNGTTEIVSVNADGGDEKVLFAGTGINNGRLIPGSAVIAVEEGYRSFWIPAEGGARGEFPAQHIPLAVSDEVVFLKSDEGLVKWENGAATSLAGGSVYAAVANQSLVYFATAQGLYSTEYR